MAIERKPDSSIGSASLLMYYRPPVEKVAKYHTVKPNAGETLATVAQTNGVSVEELVGFNFPGGIVNGRIVPPVVNWYLGQHVEFKCPNTRNGENRQFKGGERLAIPLRTTYIEFEDPLVITASPPPKASGVWFGGGYKGGTTFGLVGIETTQIVCVSADGKTGFTATVSGTRFPALGIGASGGPMVVLITSMKHPGQLSRVMTGGTEFSLAVGPKLDSVIGAARYRKAVEALTRFAAKYGKKGALGLNKAQQLVKYNGQIIDIVKMLGMKLDHYEPQMFSLGSPWGGFGLEASVHFTVSEYHLNYVKRF